MKLGCITNGISDDFENACRVMSQDGLIYADLQNVWGKAVGSLTHEENVRMKHLMEQYGIIPWVLCRHDFSGLSIKDTELTGGKYQEHIESFKRTLALGKFLETKYIRIMSFSKAPLLWGKEGAGRWLADNNTSWAKLLKLMEHPVRLAEEAGVTLVVETGLFSGLNNGYLAAKFIRDLGSNQLKILWDPANCLYSGEEPWPEGYTYVREYLSHIHIKDIKYNRKKYTAEFTPLGAGDMGPYLCDLAETLRKDNYQGVVTLENCYEPNHNVYAGYEANLQLFKKLFA